MVTIVIGRPLYFEEHLLNCRKVRMNSLQIRKSITDIIQDELQKLRDEAENLHYLRKIDDLR